jgi:FkbM family methyltransferase
VARRWRWGGTGRPRRPPGRGRRARRLADGRSLYSQGKEEVLIRDFFRDRVGGTFVDVGAGHWRDGSTTYYLEAHLGWSGIAVDARGELADDWRLHRPRSRFCNCIATDHSGTEKVLYTAGSLSTTRPAHLANFEHVDPATVGVVRVRTATLTDLLQRQGLEQIDLLSMDIEGGEPAALAGLDLGRFRPELVCVETGTEQARARLSAFFRACGYIHIDEYEPHDPVNAYYTPGNGTRRGGRGVV